MELLSILSKEQNQFIDIKKFSCRKVKWNNEKSNMKTTYTDYRYHTIHISQYTTHTQNNIRKMEIS